MRPGAPGPRQGDLFGPRIPLVEPEAMNPAAEPPSPESAEPSPLPEGMDSQPMPEGSGPLQLGPRERDSRGPGPREPGPRQEPFGQGDSALGAPGPGRPAVLPLARRQLLEWQERLAAYQAPLWSEADATGPSSAEQASLFGAEEASGLAAASADPAARARALRPLALPAESLAFWRWPQAPHQGPALYFVLDRPNHLAQPLLLYVGETARADRRWKGAHDCKSYLAAYREALTRAALRATLSIRFWCEAPAATAARRALEQALIQRWKPPFNKETRGRWSTPFTAEVD